jgi:hypothetical protein
MLNRRSEALRKFDLKARLSPALLCGDLLAQVRLGFRFAAGWHLYCHASSTLFSVSAPAIDRLQIEAPVAADLESRELLFLKQPVNRRWMNS